jgi:hypothetical protein
VRPLAPGRALAYGGQVQDWLHRGGLRLALIAVALTTLALVPAASLGAAPGPGAEAAQNPQYPLPAQPQPELRYLTPSPIVRLAGMLTRTSARITLLRVRSPRGSRVTVRCRGGRRLGCPWSRRTRRSPRSRVLRFRRLERRLKAGVRLHIFVLRGQTIGKHTRFTIRKRKAPSRRDDCTLPDRPFKPVACP